ncbi:MAG: hypothetical protein LC745_09530 [Planctomycetia bacterium]|nr:hypothetical protein [Planctomycetia bacterium]
MDDPTLDDEPKPAERVPFAAFVLFEAALAPVALAVGHVLGRHPLTDFAWSAGGAVGGLVATLPMLALLAAALRWPPRWRAAGGPTWP